MVLKGLVFEQKQNEVCSNFPTAKLNLQEKGFSKIWHVHKCTHTPLRN